MSVGIGGAGALVLCLESVFGTFVEPDAAGAVVIPILDESLEYTETKYFSPQIRQSAIMSQVEQTYYHAEGDIHFEVDTNYLPYFLHCSRHTIVKTDPVSPETLTFMYKYTPIITAQASTAATGDVMRSCSISIKRNGQWFGYFGVVFPQFEFTIEDGIMKCTAHALGLGYVEPSNDPEPLTWLDANLMGADNHSIFTDSGGVTPAFAGQDKNFSSYTFTINHNGEAVPRIQASREAAYIRYGETEPTISTELDFIDKTEYNKFVAGTLVAVRCQSINDGAAWASTTDGVRYDLNNAAYETYPVGLSGMSDLVSAGATLKGLQPTGGDAYSITVRTPVDIA